MFRPRPPAGALPPLACAIVLASAAAAAAPAAGAAAERALMALETRFSQTYVSGDRRAADALLAPDFLGVTSSGALTDRDAVLADVGRTPHQASARIVSMTVRLHGDVAVVRGLEDDRDAGAPASRRHVWVDTWRRGRDGWRLIASGEVNGPAGRR